ncbi:hypothetical protein DPMN_191774, partial [Dreissena polymorpha]
KKATLYDKDSPDCVPSINIGHTPLPTTPSPQVTSARFERCKARNDKTLPVLYWLLARWTLK